MITTYREEAMTVLRGFIKEVIVREVIALILVIVTVIPWIVDRVEIGIEIETAADILIHCKGA